MKQKILVALTLIIATSVRAGDAIKIVRERLSDDRKMITVTVEYKLESLQKCDLMVGLDYESSGEANMATNTVRLNKGKGVADITAPVAEQKWKDGINKMVYVNLSPVDRGESWNPIAYATLQVDVPDMAAELRLPGRAETNVVINIKGHGKFSTTYAAYPYVDTHGRVSILPGESHIIEFDIKDGQPVNLKWVKKRTKGKEAVEIDFSNDGEIAMLTRKNEGSKIITMKCRIRGTTGGHKITGLNPVKPGMFAFDSWPPSVVSVVLFDFKYWDDYDKAFQHER